MPNPIEVLNISEFEALLEEWDPKRKIVEVHVHCTDHPRHNEFRGLASIEAMRRYHMGIGMADIAQHLTIDPQGMIWTGRPFDAAPASVRGHNGTSKQGPFMIEMVGLFQDHFDVFQGNQKDSVYAVVRAVLAKFELTEKAVRFHREFPNTGKTCPGLSLDPNAFRKDIAELLKSDLNPLSGFEVLIPRHMERPAVDRAVSMDALDRPEPDYMEVPEDNESLLEQRVMAKLIEREAVDSFAAGRALGTSDPFRDLLGHVINTSQGILSGKGAMRNTTDDLDSLIRDHLTPQFASGNFKHLVFYAHGGLVSEEAALCYARMMLPWWKSYGVYPIFFVWESSLFQSIWRKPRGMASARGIGDFWDSGVEGATQLLARKVWAEMKANARRCSQPTTDYGKPGGLYELAQRLIPWLKANPKVRLHAIGHSTGPILQARFMPLLTGAGLKFDTLSYLAPAIRTDDFAREVFPKIGNDIARLRVYTMADKAEQDDDVVHVYRKSLLYYVRNACEDKTDGRLVGLQKDFLADADLRQWFGLKNKTDLRAPLGYDPLKAKVAIEFSQHANDPENQLTEATTHGGFDNDRATMSSVLSSILGQASLVGTPGKRFPTALEFERCKELDEGTRALAILVDVGESAGCCPCCCCSGSQPSEFDREDDEDDVGGGSDDGAGSVGLEEPVADSGRAVGSRRALCVGIDSYPTAPLKGCVNDSKDWAKLLIGAGFEVKSLHNKEATRDKLAGALRKLIEGSKAGDQLVFQYAGHGTQVEDLTGDETDRFDEALVPVDYESGALLIDDDLYEICGQLKKHPGVTLTFLMDCCNSGTNTRAAPLPRSRKGQLVRFMRMPEEALSKYKRKRAVSRAGASALPPVSERDPIPGVVSFAACQDKEFAFESDGHGDFTLKAGAVFNDVLERGASNDAFIKAVLRKFGPSPQQKPMMLKPAAGLSKKKFLGGR